MRNHRLLGRGIIRYYSGHALIDLLHLFVERIIRLLSFNDAASATSLVYNRGNFVLEFCHMLSQHIVLFSQYTRLASLFVYCLQTLFFSSFDLLVELYDTEEAH